MYDSISKWSVIILYISKPVRKKKQDKSQVVFSKAHNISFDKLQFGVYFVPHKVEVTEAIILRTIYLGTSLLVI